MLWLIKFIIFGPQCKHKWKLLEAFEPYHNDKKYLYHCTECGKIKSKHMYISMFE